MRHVPEAVRQVGRRQKPRADREAKQGGDAEHQRHVELYKLMVVRAVDDREPEIDAGDDPDEHRREGQRCTRRQERMRRQGHESHGEPGQNRSLAEYRGALHAHLEGKSIVLFAYVDQMLLLGAQGAARAGKPR